MIIDLLIHNDSSQALVSKFDAQDLGFLRLQTTRIVCERTSTLQYVYGCHEVEVKRVEIWRAYSGEGESSFEFLYSFNAHCSRALFDAESIYFCSAYVLIDPPGPDVSATLIL